MENQNRKSTVLDSAVIAAIREFSVYKHQLQRMLQFIEETGKQFEFHEVVNDIKMYLEYIADQPCLRMFGLDLIRSFIGRIHDMDRLVTIPRHWVSRNGTPVFEVNTAYSRDFSPEKEKRFDNWKMTADTANQHEVIWNSSASGARPVRNAFGRGNGSHSQDFDLSRYVERRERTPGPSRQQHKEPSRIPDWLRNTIAPPSPAPARRYSVPSSTFVPGQDEINDGMSDSTQTFGTGTPFEDPQNRYRESVSEQQSESSLFVGVTPQPRDSRANQSSSSAHNQYQIPPQPHLFAQPQMNFFGSFYFPGQMFQNQPGFPMIAQPSLNQYFFPGQAQPMPNQPCFPAQAQVFQNPPYIPPQPQPFGGPWPVPPRPQPVQVPRFNPLPIIVANPLHASFRQKNSAGFPHRASGIPRHAQFSRPEYKATPSSSMSTPTSNPSVSGATSRLVSPTPTPSTSNVEGVGRMEKEKVGETQKENDNSQAEIRDDRLIDNEQDHQVENELQDESIPISNCERSGRNEKEQVHEESQTIDHSADMNDASIHVERDTQATVTSENHFENDSSANPSENDVQNDTHTNLIENRIQIDTSANQEEIETVTAAAAATAPIENDTIANLPENHVETSINAASAIENPIAHSLVANQPENHVGTEINVASATQNQTEDSLVEYPPENHVGMEINLTSATANVSENSLVPNQHENPHTRGTTLNQCQQQRKRRRGKVGDSGENVPKYSFRKTKQRMEKEFKVIPEKSSKLKKKIITKKSLLQEEALRNAESREKIRQGIELFEPETSGVIIGPNDLIIKPNFAKVKTESVNDLPQIKLEKDGDFVNIDNSEVFVVSADDEEALQVDQDDQDAFEDGNESNHEMEIETRQENEDPDQSVAGQEACIQDNILEEEEDGDESEIVISNVVSLQADKGNSP